MIVDPLATLIRETATKTCRGKRKLEQKKMKGLCLRMIQEQSTKTMQYIGEESMSKLRGEKIVGNAGENLTVFKLSMLGYAASTVKQDGVDIAVVGGAGLKVAQRVEVKTVLQRDELTRYSFNISKGSDKRYYTREDCDIIALVALDIENLQKAVLFFPVESFTSVKSLTLTKNDFLNPSDKNEWRSVLNYSQDMMYQILKMAKLKKEYKIYEKK